MRGDFPPGCSSNVIARWHPGQTGRFRERDISAAPPILGGSATLSVTDGCRYGAVIVATVDPVGHGKRFNSERTLDQIIAPVSGEITGAIIFLGCRYGAIWHPMTKPPARNTTQCNLCTPQMYACAGVLQFSALVQRHQALFSLGALSNQQRWPATRDG